MNFLEWKVSEILTLPWIIPRLRAKDDPEGPIEEELDERELVTAADPDKG